MNNTSALIIFAREPKAGQVKTRMLKTLEQDFVTDLYKAFIQDVVQMAEQVKCDGKFLYYADQEGEVPFLQQFACTFELQRQQGAQLGERMHRALMDAKAQGFERMVIIGTDCIEISPQDIETAFQTLDTHDYCIGPSQDGGYYLIGTSKPRLEAFTGINWGTETVREATVQILDQIQCSHATLPVKEDMDTIDSVQNFMERMSQSSATHSTKILTQQGLRLKST